MQNTTAKYLLFFGKLLVTCLAVYFVVRQVIHHEYFNEAKQSLWIVAKDKKGQWALMAAVVLLLMNWGVEAVKWKLLVAHVCRVPGIGRPKFERIAKVWEYPLDRCS